MALKRITSMYFKADDMHDLAELTDCQMGTVCYVISEACEFAVTSDGRWIEQSHHCKDNKPTEEPEIEYVTHEELKKAIPDMSKFISKDVVEACYRPISYEVTNLPKGTIVDYREKEIRIMCPEGTEFKSQSVGENGNPNMYYMTFKAYAPKGAVSFKEGDRGVIVDEMFDFNASAAGTDKYGRNYSVCWLALASLDTTTGTWNYFGKTSTTEKYIGWTYIVEWYDIDGIMIGTDKIRINLSNKDCHL